MSHGWDTTTITCEEKAFEVLAELCGKRWLCRGHPQCFGELVPLIDRGALKNLSRLEKLRLERESINLFQKTARFFTHPGEQGALADDIIALMVLRHYGVPTRLLDWSRSPWVAAYFAVANNFEEDGELWAFDERLYEQEGKAQWVKWPETMIDGRFDAKLTAFRQEEPPKLPDWFICVFYPSGFPRQSAQQGAYSMTAQFDRDHAEAIASLLKDSSRYHLYIVQCGAQAQTT